MIILAQKIHKRFKITVIFIFNKNIFVIIRFLYYIMSKKYLYFNIRLEVIISKFTLVTEIFRNFHIQQISKNHYFNLWHHAS